MINVSPVLSIFPENMAKTGEMLIMLIIWGLLPPPPPHKKRDNPGKISFMCFVARWLFISPPIRKGRLNMCKQGPLPCKGPPENLPMNCFQQGSDKTGQLQHSFKFNLWETKNGAFGKPCLCLWDTRHFRHFRRFTGFEQQSPCFTG